jgi:hypothetical protein
MARDRDTRANRRHGSINRVAPSVGVTRQQFVDQFVDQRAARVDVE